MLRMTALGRGLIFQPCLLACTHNNDTKMDILQISIKVYTQNSRQCKQR